MTRAHKLCFLQTCPLYLLFISVNGFLIGKNELYKEAMIDGLLLLTYVQMRREGEGENKVSCHFPGQLPVVKEELS